MDTLETIGARAKIARPPGWPWLAPPVKTEALTGHGQSPASHTDDILEANRQDVAAAKAAGMHPTCWIA